ncbi:MAG: VCBS domain-containing protein [Reyranellaceae bacterium]
MSNKFNFGQALLAAPAALASHGVFSSAFKPASDKAANKAFNIVDAAALEEDVAIRAGTNTVWFQLGGENLAYLDGPTGLTITGGSITSLTLRNDAGQVVLSITGFAPVDAAQFYTVMAGDDSAAAYQMLVSLGAGATVITGSDISNGAVAGTGNDTADMAGGDDLVVKFHVGNLTYDGGDGSDTLSFKAEFGNPFPTPFAQQLVVDLGAGTGQNPYGGELHLTSVENIIGTPNADKITGSDAANIIGDAITETAGDIINALGGDDVIGFFSFAGFDPQLTGAKIDGGTGTDTLVFQYDQKGNVLDLVNQANNAGMFRGSTFTSIERFVVGDDFATGFGELAFKGDDTAQYLEVRIGSLSVDLGGGDDTLKLAVASTNGNANVAEGGAGIDRLIFNASGAGNLLDLASQSGTGPFLGWKFTGFEIFELATDGSGTPSSFWIDFNGDATGSTVIGGAGADFFRGRGGDDVLLGGAGGDTYTYTPGDGNDTITDIGFGETDTLRLLGVAESEATLTRSGNDLLVAMNGSGEVIRVTDHFLGGALGLEKIEFTGGVAFDRQQILDHVVGAAPDASPKVGSALVSLGNEGSGVAIVDLLQGATDSDGDKLSVANIGGLGPGMTVVGNTLHVDRSDVAYESYNGGGSRNVSVTYDVVDGRGGSVAQKATVWVTGINDAAVIGGKTTGAVTEDGETTTYGFLSIVDVDVNTITGTSEAKFQTQASTALKYGTFSLVDANAGLWTYKLDNANAAVQALKTGQTLTETAQVHAFDNTAGTVVITINGSTDGNEPPNTAPSVGGPVTAAASEDSGVAAVDLLTGASDLDGDPLQVVNLTGLVAGVTQSGNTLVVDTGNAAFQDLAAGAQRQIGVGYGVSDGKGGITPQTAAVTVTGINDPAVIGGSHAGTVSEDGVLTASGALTITDADAGQASFQAGTLAGIYGSLALTAVGAWTYSLNNASPAVQALNAGQTLADTIVAHAFDGTAQNIVITINGTDEPIPPVGHDDAYVVQQGKGVTTSATSGVLFNDEGTPVLTASLVAGPSHGALQLAIDGSFTYTPFGGFTGIDDFTYRVSHGGQFQDARTEIHVVPVLVGTTTTLNLLGLNAEQQIASTYAAFFGRGADRSGFEFWVNEFNVNLPTQGGANLFANIASSFGVSDEAKALYPFLVSPFGASDGQIGAFIDAVYNNLFNRGSDAAGLAYWTGQVKATLAAGQFVGSVLINIMSGAQDTADGKDITTLLGKVAVGLQYVHEQQSHHTVWAGASDAAAATALLHAVTADAPTVLTGMKTAEALIAAHA